MIHCKSKLFNDICYATDQQYQKQIHCFFIDSSNPFLYFCKKESKSSQVILSVSLVSGNYKKLITIDNWISRQPKALRSFIILLRYALTLWRYSSIDNILFLSLSLSY